MNMSEMNLAATAKQDELLDISIERVDKINSPLLVVGLGGTGADIVRTIKRTFSERYNLPKDANGNFIPIPRRTAYLALDTSNSSAAGFSEHEFIDISLEGLSQILKPENRDHNLTDFERRWVNKNLDARSSGLGAGTYRQAARFMLSRNYSKVYNAISSALNGIVTVQDGEILMGGRIEIVLASGICGGTGSGTFLDIAQIIRHCMRKEENLQGRNHNITGYIVMPDVSLSQPAIRSNASLQRILQQNGYAALKELDFWMRVGEHKTPYSSQYSGSGPITWDMPPFDSCVLMSQIGVNNQAYADGYNMIQKTIAENLLHYLAAENIEYSTTGEVLYTYIQYEDNLKAAITAMDKRLPLFYGYRAVGAYTKRIPKKKILYYEGSLLFNTFIPERDPQGRLVPSPAMLQDGKSGERARDIVGNVVTMYNNFSNTVKLPNFTNVQPNEKDKVEKLRLLQPLPHNRSDHGPNPWLSTVVYPTALNSGKEYLDAAWERFQAFAQHVILDPNLGPFSLLNYLSDMDKGLMPALREELKGWKANASNFKNNISRREDECKHSWGGFVKPPLLGGSKAIASYLKSMVDYYDAERKAVYMRQLSESLELLVQRVEEYRNNALRPLCNDIERLEEEFAHTHNVDTVENVSDIFSLNSVKDRIDKEFKEGNVNNKVTRDFLDKLYLASFKRVNSVDPHGTGISFIYKEEGKNNALEAMRESLDLCFGTVNSQSLDSILDQTVGSDINERQKKIDELGQSVISNAQPLFAQNTQFASEEVAKYNYLSVPDNAQEYIQRYGQTLGSKNTVPKGSTLRDHMYCTSAWDGLPLYRYSLMDSLENAYMSGLSNAKLSMGIHLVFVGDTEAEYNSNWVKLPSPTPYYYFRSNGDARAVKEYQEIQELVTRARENGMLSVDSSLPIPVIKLNLFYVDNIHQTVKAAQTMVEEIDQICNSIDQTTGAKLSWAALRTQLDNYLRGSVSLMVPCEKPSLVLAPLLGLQNDPVNPWDNAIAADPVAVEQARKNHVLLSNEMAVAMLASHPMLLLYIKKQIEGFEYANQIVQDISRKDNAWEPRIAYADQVADMLIHQVIRQSVSGWQYTSPTGERLPLLQPTLLADDLKDETGLCQVAAFLGDLHSNNLMRQELENQVRNKKAELAAKDNAGELSKDEQIDLLNTIELAKKLLESESKTHKAAQTRLGADEQKEAFILTMLGKIVNKLNNDATNLSNLLSRF